MRIRRRWIIGSLVGLGALGAIGVGVVVAAPAAGGGRPRDKILERAAAILGIETEKLEGAFEQARADLQKEQRDEYLKKLVDDGVLKQQEADDIGEWLDAMPPATNKLPFKHRIPGPVFPGHPDTFVVPKPGPLLGVSGILDRLVEDGVITREKADEIRGLLKEGELEFRQFEIRPPHGEFHFRDARPFRHGPHGFPHGLPFEWRRVPQTTPEATPGPST